MFPHGGHFLRLNMSSSIRKISISEERGKVVVEEGQLNYLPEQYVRYKSASDIITLLKDKTSSSFNILDIGGAPGQAYSFFLEEKVTIMDQEWCDIPSFLRGDFISSNIDFSKYDTVVTIDVLEHMPRDRRVDFCEKLMITEPRIIIIAAPFDSENVKESECALSEILEQKFSTSNEFLAEHKKFGLPDLCEVKKCFQDKGYQCVQIPVFHLKHWLFLMGSNLSRSMSALSKSEYNTFYNKHFEEYFHKQPSYGHILFFSKSDVDLKHVAGLAESYDVPSSDDEDIRFSILQTKMMAELAGSHASQKTLILARAQLGDMGKHISNMEQHVSNKEQHISNLEEIVKNREDQLKHSDRIIAELNGRQKGKEDGDIVRRSFSYKTGSFLTFPLRFVYRKIKTVVINNRKHKI